MNRDSNSYTFLFATIMVFVVASSLAYTSISLKEKQNENVRKEQMQNILSTIGINTWNSNRLLDSRIWSHFEWLTEAFVFMELGLVL